MLDCCASPAQTMSEDDKKKEHRILKALQRKQMIQKNPKKMMANR